MCNLLHILQRVECRQYLVVVEAQHATHYYSLFICNMFLIVQCVMFILLQLGREISHSRLLVSDGYHQFS